MNTVLIKLKSLSQVVFVLVFLSLVFDSRLEAQFPNSKLRVGVGEIQSFQSEDSLNRSSELIQVLKYSLANHSKIDLIEDGELNTLPNTYVIYGDFLESDQEFSLLLRVVNLTSGFYTSVPIVSGNGNRRLFLIQETVDKLVGVIERNSLSRKNQLKVIGFLPSAIENNISKYYRDLLETIVNQTVANTPTSELYKSISLGKAKHFYYSDLSDRALMDSLNSDALIKFQLVKAKKEHRLKVNLSIRDTNERFMVNELSIDEYSEPFLRVFLNDLFSKVINEDHNWTTQKLVSIKEAQSSEILKLGIEYAIDGDLFSSNFAFHQLIAKSNSKEERNEAILYMGKNYKQLSLNLLNEGNASLSDLYLNNAEYYFRKAITNDTLNNIARLELGNILLEKGNHDLALKEFNSIQHIDSKFPSLNFYLGKAQYWNDQNSEALINLKQVEPTDTLYSEAIFLIGQVYYETAALDSAKLYFQRSINLNHRIEESKYALSLVFSQEGVYQYFEEEYETSVNSLISSISFGDIDISYYYLSQNYKKLNRFRESIEALEMGLNQGVFKQDILYFSIGIELYQIWSESKYKQDSAYYYSKKSLKKHIQLFPNDPDGYSALGTVLASGEELDAALSYMERSFELDSSNYDNALNFQEILLLSGKTQESLNIYEYLIQEESNFLSAENSIIIRFLALAAKMLEGQSYESEDTSIRTYLRGGNIVTTWVFTLFDDWVENTTLEPEKKNTLTGIRALLAPPGRM